MAIDLSQLPTGTVTGVFGAAGPDGADTDRAPDGYAATGTFTFTPSVGYLKTTSPSQRIELLPLTATIDANGNLVDVKNPTFPGLVLTATDSAIAAAANLQWTVTAANLQAVLSTRNFEPVTITIPAGGTVDLIQAIPVLKAAFTATQPVGVPQGGTTGQVLAKNSGTDFDTKWVAGGSTGLISDTATDSTHTWSAQKLIASLAKAGSVTSVLRGVNEAGYDFVNNSSPGTDNTTQPSNASILLAAVRGATFIRLPYLWEYLQPTPQGPFNSTFLAKLVGTIKYARSLGLDVDLDCHNYGRGFGHVLNDGTFGIAWLVDLYQRLCATDGIGNDPGVHFGLMNEVHDLPSTPGTVSGSELFTNPGFETDLTGWSALNSATIARTTAQFHTGTASASITAGSNTSPQIASAAFAIDATKQYQLSYWSKAATVARQVFCVINFSGTATDPTSGAVTHPYISTITPNSSFVTNSTTGWTQVTVSGEIVIPSGATQMSVGFIVNGASAGEVHYLDDVTMKVATGGKSGAQVWESAIQTLITTIRGTGSVNRIYWGGYNYSAAATLWSIHPTFVPVDPINNTWVEAHYYADGAGSGTLSYAQTVSYAQSKGAVATSSMDALLVNTYTDLVGFLNGAKNRGIKAYIGEIGAFQSTAPITAAGNTVAANELALWSAWLEFCYQIFDAYEAAVTYWAAGDTFASFNYAYSMYLGVPNAVSTANPLTNVAAVVEAHYSKAGALNANRIA